MNPNPNAAGAAPDETGPAYLLPTADSEVGIPGVSGTHKPLVLELIEAVVLTVIIFIIVQTLLPNRVVLGQSMEPSLQNNERLFLDGASYFHYDANFLTRLLGDKAAPDH